MSSFATDGQWPCASPHSATSVSPMHGRMGFLDSMRKLSRKDSTSSRAPRSPAGMVPAPLFSRRRSDGRSPSSSSPSSDRANPYSSISAPTRRPAPVNNGPPPAYSPPEPNSNVVASAITTTADDPYAFLSTFDTIFLIDDSGSMAGRSWRETAAALRTIAPICTSHDADGIDLYFLNHADSAEYKGVQAVQDIERIFSHVRPGGGTPTGIRLNHLLKPYLARYESAPDTTKPLNIIVITDGVPSDDVESVLIAAAKKLDRVDAPAWQIGIQFFQVGNEQGARAALEDLDDGLAELGGGVRDIVDTVPWRGDCSQGLSGESILKVVLGAVTRRLDRRRNSTDVAELS